jgi:hypothetical protein
LIHDGIAAAAHDLGALDGAVAADVDFDGADEGFVLLEDRGRLIPLAEKAVVDEVVIPSKFAGGASAAGFCGGARTRGGGAGGLGFGEGFFLGFGFGVGGLGFFLRSGAGLGRGFWRGFW